MLDLLWTLPAFPLASFVVLALFGRHLSKTQAAAFGAGSVGLSAVVAVGAAIQFLSSPPPGHSVVQTVWTWMAVGDLTPGISFHYDSLTLVMTLVVTCVGFLIHFYSTEFMEDENEEGYSRFFAYMNLFVCMMLVLVMADNLVLLYLGWEGVGLCSYLLIGYWYQKPENGYAARKAFVVTRVGDTAMAIGLFLLFRELGTLNIQEILESAEAQWAVGSGLAVASAALLFGGAVGKSAQLPLQTWLPDAMAGPTPVSALIHAATMVTAGVYLVARTHTLFELAPAVMTAVAVVGVATLLLSGFSALAQSDIKRVLAYSTISQLGYMFLALGVGAWAAGIFHLMTHAFFKALLFLGAGAVATALHHEHDMFKMGGLKKELPVIFWVFVIGGAALAGFPLVTAGFYSKDLILWQAWSGEHGSPWLWAAGWLGAFVTAIYTFRMIFIVFFGEAKTEISHRPGRRMTVPLLILAVLSVIGGFVELPATLGNVPLFSHLLETSLPSAHAEHHGSLGMEALFQVIAAVTALAGIGLAYLWFLRKPRPDGAAPGLSGGLGRFWLGGWGFDRLYDVLFVNPVVAFARINKDDVVDQIYHFLAWLAALGHRAVRPTQNGRLRWYAAALALGTVIVVAMVVLP